jgi:hypothetical protein
MRVGVFGLASLLNPSCDKAGIKLLLVWTNENVDEPIVLEVLGRCRL